MPIPVYYRKSGEQITQSFDYLDMAAAVGYKRYYAVYGDSGKFLSINTFDSSLPKTYSAVTSGAYTVMTDQDYNLTFKSSQVINGNIYIQMSIGQYTPSLS